MNGRGRAATQATATAIKEKRGSRRNGDCPLMMG